MRTYKINKSRFNNDTDAVFNVICCEHADYEALRRRQVNACIYCRTEAFYLLPKVKQELINIEILERIEGYQEEHEQHLKSLK